MGSLFHNEKKLLTDFYMWMVENDYDHNIRIRVENKAELFLLERGENEINSDELQLKQTDVIKSVCEHEETETLFMGGSEYMVICKYCRETLSE